MKAAIVPFDAVELFAADGASLGHFLCIGRWEGLSKFQNPINSEVFICVEPSGLAATFERLFTRIDMTRKVASLNGGAA